MDAVVSTSSGRRAAEPFDPVREQILDAALAQFELAGIRRSSVEDVARRAGVSRITVYRRFERKDRLIAAMAQREARRVIATVDARTAHLERFADRVAEGFVVMLGVVREHPLVRQLLAVEPEETLRYLTIEGAPVIAVARDYVAAQIRRAQQDGDAPPYDPEPVAEIVARLAHSLLLTPEGVIPLGDEAAERCFAREQIVPLLLRGAGASARTACAGASARTACAGAHRPGGPGAAH